MRLALRALLIRLGIQANAGTPTVQVPLLVNEQTFFGATVSRVGLLTIVPALLANTQTFYPATVTTGPVTVTAPLLVNTQTFFGATVSHPTASVDVPLLANTQTFYAANVVPVIKPPLLVNTQVFYGATLVRGNVPTIEAPLLVNSQTFYGPTVVPGPVRVTVPKFTNPQTFYGATVHGPINVPLLVNTQRFYGATVKLAPITVMAPLLTNSQTFYGAKLNLNVSTAKIVNTQTFYGATVTRGSVQSILPPLLTNSQTFYGASIGRGIKVPLLVNVQAFFGATVRGSAVTTTGIGRTVGYNAGTAADYIVAQDGSGTHTTIASALTAVGTAANKTIRVKAGTYYEQPTLTASGLKIARYGTDEPVISGGLKLTGWAQCTSADAATVGSHYASIYKVRIGTTSLDHSAYNALLLTENAEPLNIVTRRRDESDLFEQSDDNAFFRRDQGDDVTIGTTPVTITNSDGTTTTKNAATTITHPSVLGVGTWTDAQLANATAMLLANPNVPVALDIASASSGVLTLSNPNNVEPDLSPSLGAYALMNILPYMAQGQWGYVNNNDGTLSIYVWPNDTANLTANMEIARRKIVLTITGPSITLDGLTVTHTADTASNTAPIYVNAATGTTIKETLVKNFSHAQKGYGGIYAKSTVNFTLANSEITNGQNQYGFFCAGGRIGYNGTRVHNNYIHRCSQTGPRFYGTTNGAFYLNLVENCGLAAHANKINFYEGCDQILVLANNWINCGGYATIQESSRLLMLNCMCPSDNGTTGGGGRAFVDQTHSSAGAPTDPSENYIINCAFPKVAGAYSATSAVNVGQPYWSVNWTVFNTVAEGISVSSTARLTAEDYNVLTKGTAILGAHDDTSTQAALFNDPASDDFTALTPGSILATKTGKDVTTIIQQFEAWFPDVNIRQTINGDAWNPATPGVGPYGPGNWPT